MDSNLDKQLCFLVGCPRSGTTWLQRLLQTHPAICGGEESDFFTLFGKGITDAEKFVRNNRKTGPLLYIDRYKFDQAIKTLWMAIFEDLYADNELALIHLEKTPYHMMHLNEIVHLFPQSKIIVLIRDSRACVSSLIHASQTWGDYWAPGTYKNAAVAWWQHMNAFRKWQRTHPEHPHLILHYENAVADQRGTLKQMLLFLSVEHDDKMIDDLIDRYEYAEKEMNDPKGFKRRRGIGGWRQDLPLWGKLVTWRYTRKMMKNLGYECGMFG